VRSLLERYRDLSGGKLQVRFLDPEPFSDAEDSAVVAGLKGVRLNQEGEQGYFGLVGTNATDNESSIAFFTPERERFLEYDVTKLVHTLANPKKRTIGLISGVALEGTPEIMVRMGAPPSPPQLILDQIKEFFEVKSLGANIKEVPADIDVLMLVQPEGLTPEATYAIDQFALGGGKILAFVDPVTEMSRTGPMGMPGIASTAEVEKLLKAWGVDYDPKKVAADITYARRVQFGRGNVTEYVAWLQLDAKTLDQRDVLSAGIERLNLASAGVLAKADGATTEVTPILSTTPRAMQIGVEKIGPIPDAPGLLRSYKPEGKPLMLAVRVAGTATSAFPDGAPKAEKPKTETPTKEGKAKEGKGKEASKPSIKEVLKKPPAKGEAAAKPHIPSGTVNVVVIADTDMLFDQFWVEIREFMGQQVGMPTAHNAALVLAALENLSGSDALVSLRARGVSDRPFELVDSIRRDAERRFRDKEFSLRAKLKEAEQQLAKLEKQTEGEGGMLIQEKDRQAIEKIRTEMLGLRRELREVKRELRKDIDQLDGTLKFINIAAVPLLIGIGGIGWAAYRRRRAANGSS
jgi:ABC-type uncharacterized transport system involved in gliding motility auxiliary subunit